MRIPLLNKKYSRASGQGDSGAGVEDAEHLVDVGGDSGLVAADIGTHLQAHGYFAERGARANVTEFAALMQRAGGAPPREGDEITVR